MNKLIFSSESFFRNLYETMPVALEPIFTLQLKIIDVQLI